MEIPCRLIQPGATSSQFLFHGAWLCRDMRLLHTADWHLGARLVERDRLAEHAAFLDWLVETLRSEKVDTLLVSGDIFDAANPPQEAVSLYFDFLRRLADLKTTRAVITSGNHDSAQHLDAPRELLRRFEVHVYGAAGFGNVVQTPDAVIAAVPFLRERDLRGSIAGETATQAHELLLAGIRAHYTEMLSRCRAVAQGRKVIAMGHLTALGGLHSESERDIHIGNLGAVGAEVFAGFDFTALGHLHRPQTVNGCEMIRYSGSPIALSFPEAADTKSVVLLDTQTMKMELLPVPVSRLLTRAKASRATLTEDLAAVPAGCWAEVTVRLEAPEMELDRLVRDAAAGRFEVLKVLTDLPESARAAWEHTGPVLSDLSPREVFRELLTERGVEEEPELMATFEKLLSLHASQSD